MPPPPGTPPGDRRGAKKGASKGTDEWEDKLVMVKGSLGGNSPDTLLDGRMFSSYSLERITRYMSWALRHRPDEIGLRLDPLGRVYVD